jgi:hypothetical protein
MRNAKRRNPETGTSTKSFADREITPFRSSGYRELECRNTSPQECRNAEMRNVKNTFWCRFRLPGVGVSKHFTTEIAKCRNAKLRHGVSGIATWSFGVSGIATWSVKISHHKNFAKCEMRNDRNGVSNSRHAKSRNAERDYCESRRLEGKNVEIPSAVRLGKEGIRLWSFVDRWSGSISGIATWRVEMLRNRNSRHAKSRIAEIRNERHFVSCNPTVQVNLNMIGGLLFHLTVNWSVTIQLAKLIHDSWSVGDSVVFLP